MSFDFLAWNMEREGKDPLQALANLVHLCPGHDMARCQLVTALLLSVWQLTGHAFSETVPSFMIVNCNPNSHAVWTALTDVLQRCMDVPERPPATVTSSTFVPGLGNPALCRQTMLAYMSKMRTLRASGASPALVEAEVKKLRGNWTVIKADVFPNLALRQLHEAFDADFGVVSNDDDCISCLVPDSKNREILRKLLRAKPTLCPMPGVGNSMDFVPKRVSLVGTVPVQEWNAFLTRDLLWSSLPTFFLPCDSPETIQVPDVGLLRSLVLRFIRHFRSGVYSSTSDPSRVEVDDDSLKYMDLIHGLTKGLPGDAAFRIQFLLRQLYSVVNILTLMAAPTKADPATTNCEPGPVARDLYVTAVRGIAYGLASLGFHRVGFPLLENNPHADAILDFLRQAGRPVRRRDIQRKVYTLTAKKRDELIERLDKVGLVSIDGKHVETVPLDEYLSGIPQRERFPAVTLLTRKCAGRAKASKPSAA